MQTPEILAVIRFAQVLLRVVSERLLLILGMVICAVLFGWVMLAPDWIRVAGACAFAILVYLPIVRQDRAQQQRKEGEPT